MKSVDMGVWDRIEKVIERGLVPSKRAWVKRAGLSSGYFSSMHDGMKTGRLNGLGIAAMKKLASSASVRLEWLMDGTGQMCAGDPPDAEASPKMPPTAVFIPAIMDIQNPKLRKALVMFAIEAQAEWDRHSITHHLSLKNSDGAKLTEEEWLHEIRNYAVRLRKGFGSFGYGVKKADE